MLLPNDQSPKYSLYYIGGLLLKILKEQENHDFFLMYDEMKAKYDISFKLYVLTIDWLFLSNILKMDSQGGLTYVS